MKPSAKHVKLEETYVSRRDNRWQIEPTTYGTVRMLRREEPFWTDYGEVPNALRAEEAIEEQEEAEAIRSCTEAMDSLDRKERLP